MNWLKAEPTDFNRLVRQEENGVIITLGISPFDVPDHITGEYDAKLKRFVIGFTYPVSREDTNEIRIDEHVSGRVGAKSGRLYALMVDVDGMQVESVGLKLLPILQSRLGHAFEQLKSRVGPERPRDAQRSDLNAQLVESVRERYLPQLAGVIE